MNEDRELVRFGVGPWENGDCVGERGLGGSFMKFWGIFSALMMTCGVVLGAPVVPGLHGKHSLTMPQQGHVLTEELACAACHEGLGNGAKKSAPDLSAVGDRVTQEYLERYLADPHQTHPGTTMPDVLVGLPAAEKKEVSRSIASYLTSLRSEKVNQPGAEVGDKVAGREIYHEVGCVACHGAGDHGGVKSLSHVSAKYHHGALGEFLLDPVKVRPSGRMPNLKLSQKEAADLEAYLGGIGKASPQPPAEEIAQGKAHFERYNCASCHTMDGVTPKKGPKLDEVNSAKGCLTGEPLDYQLSEKQKKAMEVYLAKPVKLADDDRIKVRLTQLNCISCHQRDDFGGVAEDLDAFFHSTEEALGDASRIPPPLTKIGGKLRSEWLNKVLYDGLSVRPYMTTRMPQYGREALGGLPGLLAKVDLVPVVELPEPGQEDRPMVSNGGHLLLGTDGLNCISCHNYNGKDGPGMKGLDLITTYQRLQPGWYYEFMQNPSKHRPGIIMPNYWPDGKAVQTEILNGDTHEQLRALWYQFSLGRSARDPKGLRSEPNQLIVTDKVRVYRGRSRIAGYRGIAVGFPGGLNYAFNAENGALSGIWKGDYVTANWQSQGAGDFNPAARAIELAQDLPFLRIVFSNDENERGPSATRDKMILAQLKAWPLMPVTTKENPVISDPLYPKNYGYAFQGYAFGEDGNPTFRYELGKVEVEDTFTSTGEKTLQRTISFSSDDPQVFVFRALTGKVTMAESGDSISTDDLRIGAAEMKFMVREFGSEGQKEALTILRIAKGKTTYKIDYEILR